MFSNQTLEHYLLDGDIEFVGVNEFDPPVKLARGEVSSAKNHRFTLGEAEPRLGIFKLPWTNQVQSGSNTPIPYGTIYGAAEYRDSDGLDWGIVAADGNVYRTREGTGSSVIQLPPGVSITYTVTFTQTFNGMVMFRGTNGAPLYMKDLDSGFVPISLEANTISGASTPNPTDGTTAIPQADSGEWIGNRMFIPYETSTEKDLLAISDYLNATRYKSVFAQARINQGSSDKLNRFFKFSETKGIAFKEHSIYALYNIQSDLSDMIQDEVTREFGLKAPKSVVLVGREEGDQAPSMAWFLAEKQGVCAVLETPEGKLQVLDVPVSRQMERTVRRINWKYAHNAVAEWFDGKYYLAVPLDEATQESPEIIRGGPSYSAGGTYEMNVVIGATYKWTKGASDTSLTNGGDTVSDTSEFTALATTVTLNGTNNAAVTASLKRVYEGVNNAVMVFDFRRGRWTGTDTGSGIMVKEWLRLPYFNQRRLYFLGNDGFVNLYEEETSGDEVMYESVGSNIVSVGVENYNTSGFLEKTVIPGRQYTYKMGANSYQYEGAVLLTISDPTSGTFVAQSDKLYIYGTFGLDVLDEIKLVSWVSELEPFAGEVVTRGYRTPQDGRKKFVKGAVHLGTWYPSYSLDVLTDGHNESKGVFSARTKSRENYYRPFGLANYATTNINDDHAVKHREDYSVVLQENTASSGGIEAGKLYMVESSDVTSACSISYNSTTYNNGDTFTGVSGVTTFSVSSGAPLVYKPDSFVLLGENGIDPDVYQETTENFRLPLSRGRYVQFRIRSTQGRVKLLAAGVAGKGVDHRNQVHS